MPNKPLKIMIAIPCLEHLNPSAVMSFVRLVAAAAKNPDYDIVPLIFYGIPMPHVRNVVVEELLKQECDYLLSIDDDEVYPPNVLDILMGHKKDIVAGLYFKRNAPPVTPNILNLVQDGPKKIYKEIMNYEKGLIRVDAVGMGMTLIRAEIFRKIRPPWFLANYPEFSEDVYFCLQAKLAGYEIWADTNLVVSHILSGPVAVGEHTFLRKEFKY
jgi:hypothetical protein